MWIHVDMCMYIYLEVYFCIDIFRYFFCRLLEEAVTPRQLAVSEFKRWEVSVHASFLCAVRSYGSTICVANHVGQTFFNVDWKRVPSFHR